MSYLLGYQKWRKLHESAKYKSLYEQEEKQTATPITFAIYSRTDTSPFRDWMLRTKQKWTNVPTNIITDSYNVGLWEIELKDALLGSWDKAVRSSEVWSNDKGVGADQRSVRDTFECEVLKLNGD
jgi:hypothetical protein